MALKLAPTVTQEIPEYLKTYVVTQDPTLYTPMDHASWRYILKISHDFFAQYAHQKYLDGLKETGISLERIPRIEEMDHCLRNFGWRAVAVSGFIPPAVFMEFLSLGILPIACEMRQIEHIAYTPAPDIVHEAAGHAPIISDPEYADYLRSYGELARRAIFSSKDMAVYEAIRDLSVVKEDPKSNVSEIEASQARLDQALRAVDYVSEATQLSRMGWWTFEYGLVGKLENPKLYGAGLLSSVGESYQCLGASVIKYPFSLRCVDMSYDITKPQPQLFVAPDFHTLKLALRELENTMAFKRGGIEGLERAKQAKTTTTTVLDSGIQMSGCLSEIRLDELGRPAFLKYTGPVQLSHDDQEIENQGVQFHAEGFSTPVGILRGFDKSPARLTDAEIKATPHFEFESGIKLSGTVTGIKRTPESALVISFQNCTIRWGSEILYQPDWGKFDLACGGEIISVFGGAADRKKYLAQTGGFHQSPQKQKTNLTAENRALNELYEQVRNIRTQAQIPPASPRARWTSDLENISESLEKNFPSDWLLRFELLELNELLQLHAGWAKPLRASLEQISKQSPDKKELIQRGLRLLPKG